MSNANFIAWIFSFSRIIIVVVVLNSSSGYFTSMREIEDDKFLKH